MKAEAPPQPAYNTALPVETQMLQLARFVGLIPFLDDFHLDGGNDEDVDPDSLDVWCVLSLLALLAHTYKYWRRVPRLGGCLVLSLLALLVHKYKY